MGKVHEGLGLMLERLCLIDSVATLYFSTTYVQVDLPLKMCLSRQPLIVMLSCLDCSVYICCSMICQNDKKTHLAADEKTYV
jgi:hypothetical protein